MREEGPRKFTALFSHKTWHHFSMQPPSPFATPRVRLERIRDGWLTWGWLPYLGGESARLRPGSPQEPVALGERFTVQVQGSARVTTFMAEVVGQEAGEVVLRILGEMRCAPPAMPPRSQVHQLQGVLRADGVETSVFLIDASDRGAGLLLSTPVLPGVQVTLEVPGENGPVQITGEVRYCRPLDTPPGHFRIGLQFQNLSPWTAAQWARLIQADPSLARRAA